MGVVDVLPSYLSSVYLFWDPGLPQLALGKVTAMFEVAWVQRAQRESPQLRFYCMGAHLRSPLQRPCMSCIALLTLQDARHSRACCCT